MTVRTALGLPGAILVSLLICPGPAAASAGPPLESALEQEPAANPRPGQRADSLTASRIDGVSRLWGQVKYFHPALAYRSDVDWDEALVAAVPRVLAARSSADYAGALADMLAVLGDPATRIVSADTIPAPHVAETAAWRLADDGILVLRVGSYASLPGSESQAVLAAARDALPSARAVVLDLRAAAPVSEWAAFQLSAWVGPIERLLIDAPLVPPGVRRRVYYGFPSPQPFASGQYRSGLLTTATPRLAPAQGARRVPAIVLLNRHSGTLPGTVAAQAAGSALIVLEGGELPAPGGRIIALPEGLEAIVRVSEAIFPDGRDGALIPDTIVPGSPAGAPDAALETAIALASSFRPSAVPRPPLPSAGSAHRDPSYADLSPPDAPHRVLALARLWNAIEHFYPYKHLLDAPWGDVQKELAPRFLAAETNRAYAEAVAAMATRIQDSHTYLAGGPMPELFGAGYPPIRVRWIEDQPVVASLRHPDRAEGVAPGDVVLRVDGEDAIPRLLRYAELTSASTEASRMDRAAMTFLNGPVGSRARLVLGGPDGRQRTAELERIAEDYTTLYNRERTGEVIRLLEDGIGYMDLDRLTPGDVDAMFERLADTRAIVFDMRGYPRGTVWWIAPRLAEAERTAALFTTPMPGHGSPHPSGETFEQTAAPDPSAGPRYTGRTVMLIDERTQSQAEHTGLYLRAANGTRFVGSNSAGANGEVTAVTLPGGITVGFTGQSVRHPDGSELQRIGLIPDVEVRPTIAGLRAGRDEVLERALAYLREIEGTPD